MWHDIHNHREELLSHPVVASLVSGSLQWQPQPLQTNWPEEDKHLTPGSIALPVPVDSSQLSAVLEAGRGSSFILYGLRVRGSTDDQRTSSPMRCTRGGECSS